MNPGPDAFLESLAGSSDRAQSVTPPEADRPLVAPVPSRPPLVVVAPSGTRPPLAGQSAVPGSKPKLADLLTRSSAAGSVSGATGGPAGPRAPIELPRPPKGLPGLAPPPRLPPSPLSPPPGPPLSPSLPTPSSPSPLGSPVLSPTGAPGEPAPFFPASPRPPVPVPEGERAATLSEPYFQLPPLDLPDLGRAEAGTLEPRLAATPPSSSRAPLPASSEGVPAVPLEPTSDGASVATRTLLEAPPFAIPDLPIISLGDPAQGEIERLRAEAQESRAEAEERSKAAVETEQRLRVAEETRLRRDREAFTAHQAAAQLAAEEERTSIEQLAAQRRAEAEAALAEAEERKAEALRLQADAEAAVVAANAARTANEANLVHQRAEADARLEAARRLAAETELARQREAAEAELRRQRDEAQRQVNAARVAMETERAALEEARRIAESERIRMDGERTALEEQHKQVEAERLRAGTDIQRLRQQLVADIAGQVNAQQTQQSESLRAEMAAAEGLRRSYEQRHAELQEKERELREVTSRIAVDAAAATADRQAAEAMLRDAAARRGESEQELRQAMAARSAAEAQAHLGGGEAQAAAAAAAQTTSVAEAAVAAAAVEEEHAQRVTEVARATEKTETARRELAESQARLSEAAREISELNLERERLRGQLLESRLHLAQEPLAAPSPRPPGHQSEPGSTVTLGQRRTGLRRPSPNVSDLYRLDDDDVVDFARASGETAPRSSREPQPSRRQDAEIAPRDDDWEQDRPAEPTPPPTRTAPRPAPSRRSEPAPAQASLFPTMESVSVAPPALRSLIPVREPEPGPLRALVQNLAGVAIVVVLLALAIWLLITFGPNVLDFFNQLVRDPAHALDWLAKLLSR